MVKNLLEYRLWSHHLKNEIFLLMKFSEWIFSRPQPAMYMVGELFAWNAELLKRRTPLKSCFRSWNALQIEVEFHPHGILLRMPTETNESQVHTWINYCFQNRRNSGCTSGVKSSQKPQTGLVKAKIMFPTPNKGTKSPRSVNGRGSGGRRPLTDAPAITLVAECARSQPLRCSSGLRQ